MSAESNHFFGVFQPDEELSEAYEMGGHMQAFTAMQALYRQRIKAVRAEQGRVEMLDFGTGRCGVSRCISEPEMLPTDGLALFDNATEISPAFGNSRIVTASEAFGHGNRPFNMVSIAYVLCWMERDKAIQTLRTLRMAHPDAEFVIVDYMLKGRSILADLLRSKEEMKWRSAIGDAEFVRTHTRFDPQELSSLLQDADMPCQTSDVRPLDPLGIRGATVIPPAGEFFVAY